MNGDDKAKKLNAAKKKLKEFQKKQVTDVGFERAERFSHPGSVEEEHHSINSSRHNGAVHGENIISPNTTVIAVAQPNNDHIDDIERLQLERNLSPNRVIHEQAVVSNANNDILIAQIEELKSYNVSLQNQILQERETFSEQLQLQLGQLREQIQIHAQTIGILVGEKSQLQAALSQTKLTGESRQNENQELTGRLSASRQRVADLEKQTTSLTEQLQKAEKGSVELGKVIEKLKAEFSSSSTSAQELKRRNDELQERFLNKESECSNLVAANSALKNELSMLKIYVEQLTATASKSDVSQSQLLGAQNDQLRAEKAELERLLNSTKESAESLRIERDNIKRRHETDLSGLQEHIASLNIRISALSHEIDGHLQKNSELETSLGAANEQLRIAASTAAGSSKFDDAEDRAKDNMISSLSNQLSTAKRDLEELVSNNVHFHQALVDKDATIETLRNRLVELEKASADYRSVLVSVEDVRTALSRALAQNVKLKGEYEELQNAFVRITNEKAEFVDQLATTKRQLTAAEEKANASPSQQTLPHTPPPPPPPSPLTSTTPQIVTHDACVATDAVKQEVESTPILSDNHEHCHKTISQLEKQIVDLKNAVSMLEEQRNTTSASPAPSSTSKVEREVETDNFNLIDFTAFASADRNSQLETVQGALKQLEDRFGRVMREKADLIDQKERLEHLVIQLQSETDTIGEYITLYQKQRSTLKQQSEENAKFMQQLTTERTEMKTRMDELQALVLKLVASRSQEPVRILSTGPDFSPAQRHQSGGSGRASADKEPLEKVEEEWPDLTEDDTNASGGDAPPIDPISSRILQILNSMTVSLVASNSTNGHENGDDAAGLVEASVLEQMTPNTRRLVNQRLHSLRHSAAHHQKQSPGECPCCRGQVLVI